MADLVTDTIEGDIGRVAVYIMDRVIIDTQGSTGQAGEFITDMVDDAPEIALLTGTQGRSFAVKDVVSNQCAGG